ncbi:MAG: hypothetical protein JRK53_01315 [Deltaproteobacteria bacterium]|nr:hypothetical protein [Deltaproteobacteria bacterium]
MSKNSKRAVVIALVVIVVFGMAAQWLGGYQEKAKAELIAFLKFECEAGRNLVDEGGLLTHDAVAAVRADLGDWRDPKKRALWDRFRTADYWLSVFKTLFAVGILIISFVGARAVLRRITISKKVYGMFRPLPPEDEKKDGDDAAPPLS